MRTPLFTLLLLAIAAALYLAFRVIGNDYLFILGYVELQYVVIATAWIFPLPLPVLIVLGGVFAGLIGRGMGYLTLRLRGVFFAIATLALAVVLETFIVNWPFVGGSRGAYVIPPESVPVFGTFIQYLFVLMLLLAVGSLAAARLIERSRLGIGFATIRDAELAAEASGVPTLRLKLIATVLSGAQFGMDGETVPIKKGNVET